MDNINIDDLIKEEVGAGLDERTTRKVLSIEEVYKFYETCKGKLLNYHHMKYILGDYLKMYRFCQRIRDNELDMEYVKKQLGQML